MNSAFVVPKKPRFYKLGAKILKWLMLCNKVVEYEKVGKVIEAQKQAGAGYKWTSVDELDCSNYKKETQEND